MSDRPTGNTRVTGKEQFYTPPAIAIDAVDRLLALLPDARTRPWLEPAGGTGSFLAAARSAGVDGVVSYDIEPLHPDVQAGDFLTQRLDLTGAVTISNPPFGRNNSLSIPFFNHAARYSDVICFIVPRSWRKWSVQNRLDRNFHLIDDRDLTINYVTADGTPASSSSLLRTCVQTWQRADFLRPLITMPDPGIITKTTPQDADVALTVFGYGCGTVRTDFDRTRKITTQMYLRLRHPDALKALQSVDYRRFSRNVAYTEALSLPEINFLLSEHLAQQPDLAA
jgi:predicted RNA methylase